MEPDFSALTITILEAYDYSEADLARVLGVTQPTVHRIKTGRVKSPSYHLGAKLLELFDGRPQPDAVA